MLQVIPILSNRYRPRYSTRHLFTCGQFEEWRIYFIYVATWIIWASLGLSFYCNNGTLDLRYLWYTDILLCYSSYSIVGQWTDPGIGMSHRSHGLFRTAVLQDGIRARVSTVGSWPRFGLGSHRIIKAYINSVFHLMPFTLVNSYHMLFSHFPLLLDRWEKSGLSMPPWSHQGPLQGS